jgi:hypothetical protein
MGVMDSIYKKQSQALAKAVEVLIGAGFGILKAESGGTDGNELTVQCAYLGNSASPNSDPVTK